MVCRISGPGIKTLIDEMMGGLPGVRRTTTPCKCGETLVIQVITLEPGATIPFHHHQQRQEMYRWISGEGVLIMNGREFEFSESGLKKVFIGKGVVHGLRNDSDKPFQFNVVYNALCGRRTLCIYGDTFLD